MVNGSLRINLRRFFGITSLVLLLLVVRLLAGGVHEFAEAGLIPEALGEIGVVSFLVRDSTSTVLLIGLFLLPILAMLPGMQRRQTQRRA